MKAAFCGIDKALEPADERGRGNVLESGATYNVQNADERRMFRGVVGYAKSESEGVSFTSLLPFMTS